METRDGRLLLTMEATPGIITAPDPLLFKEDITAVVAKIQGTRQLLHFVQLWYDMHW